MADQNQNDPFSVAVDKALAKISKEYGIAVPKDDYVLIHLILNRELLSMTIEKEALAISKETDKTNDYFRKALVELASKHSKIIEENNHFMKKQRQLTLFNSVLVVLSVVIVFSTLIFGG